MSETVKIRKASVEDAAACALIYNYYVLNGTQTFEIKAFTSAGYAERIHSVMERGYPFLVAEHKNEVIGFAYLDIFSQRYAYRYTADLSLYVAADYRKSGIGSALYHEVELCAMACGLRKIISIITSENDASIEFHHKMGFSDEGHLQNVGYKFDRWLGVYYLGKDLWKQG